MVQLPFPETVSRLSNPYENQRVLAGAVLGGAVIAAEVAAYMKSRQASTDPGLLTTFNDGDGIMVLAPGLRTDGQVMDAMMRHNFASMGTVHTMINPRRGYNLDAIGQVYVDLAKNARGRRIDVYAHSLAGFALKELAQDEEFRYRTSGVFGKILFDSAPYDEHDVRLPSRVAGHGTRVILPDVFTQRISTRIARYLPDGSVAETDGSVSTELAGALHDAMCRTPAPVIAAQYNALRHAKPLRRGALTGVFEQAGYIYAPFDRVVNTPQASSKYSEALDGALSVIEDDSRPAGSHAIGPQFQRQVVEYFGIDVTV